MLPRSERLTKDSEFSAVYNLRRSVANSLFILYTGRLNNTSKLPRVGFVVGKKVHKNSTKRNRIKRLMREAYKTITKTTEIPVNQWQSLIFLARPFTLEVDYQQVYDGIVDCLKKANKRYGRK